MLLLWCANHANEAKGSASVVCSCCMLCPPRCVSPCVFLLSRLALYVYEYLLHVGAQKSAQTFLSEVRRRPQPETLKLNRRRHTLCMRRC